MSRLSRYRLIGKWRCASWSRYGPSTLVPAILAPVLGPNFAQVLAAGFIAAGIAVIITWVAVPLLVKIVHGWLYPKNKVSQYS